MKITVLGCGALGQLWLAALHQQAHELQGWLRVPQPHCHVNLLDNTNGCVVNESFTANDPEFLATSDFLLVTLKAWQVSDAVRILAAQLPSNCPILLLHNGIGTLDELGGLPHQPLLLGLTTQRPKETAMLLFMWPQALPTSALGMLKPATTATLQICCRPRCQTSRGTTIFSRQAGTNLR